MLTRLGRHCSDIAIVGGGISGLATSIGLARCGLKSTVYERRPFQSQSGYGIQITPNGSAVLQELGIGKQLLAMGTPVTRIEVRSQRTNAVLHSLDMSAYRRPGNPGYLLMYRPDLIGALVQAAKARSVDLRRSSGQIDYGASDSGYSLSAERLASFVPSVLVGADGAGSALRRQLNPRQGPMPVQHLLWRALLPVDRKHDLFAPDTVQLIVAPRRHLVKYKVRHGRFLNLVVVKSLKKGCRASFEEVDAAAEFEEALSGFADRHHLVERQPSVHRHRIRRGRVASCWHRQNAVLLGDALHPMPPFLAQGGNLALEDAWILAKCLSTSTSPDAAFARFSQLREARVGRLVQHTNRQSALNRAAMPATMAAGWLSPGRSTQWLSNLVARRYRWVFDWKPPT
ncbi:MAG: NAD(P)/FAD-dependent oxidoreductase [Rhodobacteraceae bacterium]|nr:NAD(P)/FAD-dependent oxidoreductase [Paracoccaceae bacterium]